MGHVLSLLPGGQKKSRFDKAAFFPMGGIRPPLRKGRSIRLSYIEKLYAIVLHVFVRPQCACPWR